MKKLFLFGITVLSLALAKPVLVQASEQSILTDETAQTEDFSEYAINKGINTEFIEKIKSGQTNPVTKFSTGNNVNIRTEPNTECKVIDKLILNTSVEVIAEYNGWSCITGETGIAFVKSDFLSEKPTSMKYIGEFKITHYCCEKYKHICGGGKGLTKMGTLVRPGVISVDPRIIPLGSKVLINGQVYFAEDTGNMIKGHIIDMAVDTHKHALDLGIYRADVYVLYE